MRGIGIRHRQLDWPKVASACLVGVVVLCGAGWKLGAFRQLAQWRPQWCAVGAKAESTATHHVNVVEVGIRTDVLARCRQGCQVAQLGSVERSGSGFGKHCHAPYAHIVLQGKISGPFCAFLRAPNSRWAKVVVAEVLKQVAVTWLRGRWDIGGVPFLPANVPPIA